MVGNMKTVTCESTSCPNRRKHHEEPNIPRGIQAFQVPDDATGPFYCSIECSVYGASEKRDARIRDRNESRAVRESEV